MSGEDLVHYMEGGGGGGGFGGSADAAGGGGGGSVPRSVPLSQSAKRARLAGKDEAPPLPPSRDGATDRSTGADGSAAPVGFGDPATRGESSDDDDSRSDAIGAYLKAQLASDKGHGYGRPGDERAAGGSGGFSMGKRRRKRVGRASAGETGIGDGGARPAGAAASIWAPGESERGGVEETPLDEVAPQETVSRRSDQVSWSWLWRCSRGRVASPWVSVRRGDLADLAPGACCVRWTRVSGWG